MNHDSGILSKTFVKDLLIVNAPQSTDSDNPKTAREIIVEVEKKLHKLVADDEMSGGCQNWRRQRISTQ